MQINLIDIQLTACNFQFIFVFFALIDGAADRRPSASPLQRIFPAEEQKPKCDD